MSLQKTELTEKNLYTLTVSVDKETFDAAIGRAYKKNIGKINVPGFRPGKAPRSIVEKMYGKGLFYEDAINDCIPAAFEEAIKESGLSMVGRPEFDVEEVGENGLTFIAKVYVKPEVSVSDYTGIEAVRTEAAATEADVDAEIERLRSRNSRTIDVTDRAAELNDIAVIDYEGSIDGKAFDGGKGTDHELTLGSGQFIPGFEEQIVGKNIGESFDVNVSFPEEYHAKELAGKPAVFAVTLKGLKKTELPELDDEFAKDVSELDTLEALRADILEKTAEKNKAAADSAFEEGVMDALIGKLEADIPECMFEVETENFVRDYDNRLRMQGLDLSTYFKYTGMNLDFLRQQFRPQAEKQVKLRLALEKIAELEGLTVSEDEIAAEYKRIAEAYNMPEEEVKKLVEPADLEADLRVKAAAEFVKSKAVAVDAKPEEEAAPAKKVTRKKTTKKTAEEGAAEAPAEASTEAPAKKTTRKTTKKASTETEAATEEAAEKPAPKKTTTKKTTAKKADEQ